MILVDTGPFVALFDPRDAYHVQCKDTLQSIQEPLFTTIPVLTEIFHLLPPDSIGADRRRDFILQGGSSIWYMDSNNLERAFALMEQYADYPMDLADASLLVAAESLNATKVFTIDRQDFSSYRIRRGHRQVKMEIVT